MLKRSFHATAKALLAGRRSGAAAFEQGPRELSKKQKKRRATRLVEKSERIDQKKAKVKSRHLSSQLDSMDINEMVGETAAKLGDTLKELMLPDGAPSQEEGQQLLLLQPKKEFENPMGLLKRLVAKRDRLERNNALAAPPVSAVGTALVPAIVDTDVDDDVTYMQVVDGVKRLAERGKVAEALKVLALVPSCGVAADCKVYTVAMAALSHKTVRNYSAAERIFDLMVKDGVTPNEIAWGALIHAQAKGKGPDAALTQIDRLKGLGVQPTVHMFTSVLNALIDAKRYDDAQELWLRMHGEGIELTKEAFTTMLKHCAKTGQVERAFFYLDEMQACRAEPDVHTYLLLFRACAEAPHWVNGYHDIIFDAMTKMEGSELMPTAEIYNAIIYAFSRAGDPVAAEFYFDEMRRKGLRPGVYTYNTLLNAYKRSQSVGALHYGSKGRYTALPERAPTEEEQAYMDVGATRVSSLSTSPPSASELPPFAPAPLLTPSPCACSPSHSSVSLQGPVEGRRPGARQAAVRPNGGPLRRRRGGQRCLLPGNHVRSAGPPAATGGRGRAGRRLLRRPFFGRPQRTDAPRRPTCPRGRRRGRR